MGPMALHSLRKKSCYGLLWPLKIHHPVPGLNLQILGPMASTLTNRPLSATERYLHLDSCIDIHLLYIYQLALFMLENVVCYEIVLNYCLSVYSFLLKSLVTDF
jgi:hypothetical protein